MSGKIIRNEEGKGKAVQKEREQEEKELHWESCAKSVVSHFMSSHAIQRKNWSGSWRVKTVQLRKTSSRVGAQSTPPTEQLRAHSKGALTKRLHESDTCTSRTHARVQSVCTCNAYKPRHNSTTGGAEPDRYSAPLNLLPELTREQSPNFWNQAKGFMQETRHTGAPRRTSSGL